MSRSILSIALALAITGYARAETIRLPGATWRNPETGRLTGTPVKGSVYHYHTYGAGDALALSPIEVVTPQQSRVLWSFAGAFLKWDGSPATLEDGPFLYAFNWPAVSLTLLDPPVIDEPLIFAEPELRSWELIRIGNLVPAPEPSSLVLALLPLALIRRL